MTQSDTRGRRVGRSRTADQSRDRGERVHVLHVLPVDVSRGAQVFAASLVREENAAGSDHHETAVVFSSGPAVLDATYRLDVRPGRSRSWGFSPAAALALQRLLRRAAPDVAVAHGGEVMKY